MASARVRTRTGWTDSNRRDAYWAASTRAPPSRTTDSPGGTRFAKATRGFSGPADRTAPMRTAITTG
jgi:hypothetical protein